MSNVPPNSAAKSVSVPEPDFFTGQLIEFVEQCVEFTLSIAPPGKLLPKQAEEGRRKEQLLTLMKNEQVGEGLRSGIELIVEYIDDLEDATEYMIVIQNIAKIGSVVQTKRDFSKEVQSLQELLGLSDACLKKVYKIATTLFDKKEYEKSGTILQVLTILNPFVYAWWHALALTFMREKAWEESLIPLAVAALLDPENPAPRIYAVECYLALEDFESAQEELDIAKEILEGQETEGWNQAMETLNKYLEQREKKS